MPRHVRFGTSSWTFAGWQGLVYRRAYSSASQFRRESLAEYASFPLFTTVGIDRGHYAPLLQHELANYARQLPVGFPCVSKVWQELTSFTHPDHARQGDRRGQENARFLDPRTFAEIVAPPYRSAFAPHAGPFVLELPSTRGALAAAAFEHRLERFLGDAPHDCRYAVELREPRLLTRKYVDILRAHGAAHVFNFWAWMPSLSEQMRMVGAPAAEFLVCRLLLPPRARYGERKRALLPFDRLRDPQPAMRREVHELICSAERRETYVLVNNKAEGSAPLTIRALCEQLAASR
ncbi:MAG: DUF72 domain-containing protein [Planctomycetota bacterium]